MFHSTRYWVHLQFTLSSIKKTKHIRSSFIYNKNLVFYHLLTQLQLISGMRKEKPWHLDYSPHHHIENILWDKQWTRNLWGDWDGDCWSNKVIIIEIGFLWVQRSTGTGTFSHHIYCCFVWYGQPWGLTPWVRPPYWLLLMALLSLYLNN